MKPIRLTMRAFGAYANEQIIDFRDLGEHRFFLIHGPTGAGKSTLLDALCFALYGETSGDQRQARQMRSDYATPGTPTEVILDFQIGEELYRVYRCPEQEVIGKRTGLPKPVKTRATLWKRTHLAETPELEGEDGHVLADKPLLVTQQVQSLLGFKSEQFRQVVMLPQGQFQQFLMAKSVERQKILEVLFQTAFFRKVEEALKARTKGVEEELLGLRQQRSALLAQVGATSEGELAEQLQQLEQGLEERTRHLATLQAQEQAAQQALQQAQELDRQWQALNTAQTDLNALEQQAEVMAAERARLIAAEKAQQLSPLETHRRQRSEELEQARQTVARLQAELAHASTVQDEVESRLKAEQARRDERTDLQEQLHHLNAIQPKVERLAALQAEWSACQRAEQQSRTEATQLEQSLELLTQEIEALNRQKSGLEKQLRETEQQARQLEEARRQWDIVQRLQSKRAEAQPDILQALEVEHNALQAELAEAQQHLRELEGHWMKGQAALLAQHLLDGEACPVCGAEDHPFPATGDALPDAEALNQQRETVNTLQAKLAEGQTHLAEQRTRHASLQTEIQVLSGLLSGPECLPELLRARIQELEAAEKMLQQLPRELSKVEQCLQAQHLEHSEQQQRHKTLQARLTEQASELATKTATLRAWEAEIAPDLREPAAYQTRREAVATALKQAEQSLNEAQHQAQEAGQQLASLQAALSSAQSSQAQAEEKLLQAGQTFEAALSEHGFPSEQAYQDARQAIPDIPALKDRLSQYEQQAQTLRSTIDQLTTALQGKPQPDLAQAEAHAQQAREAVQSLREAQVRQQEQHRQLQQVNRQLSDIQAQSATLEKNFGTLGLLAQVAGGKNEPGVSFNRFVLSAMLDEVLEASSERLKIMSRGRFILHRALERSNRATSGGLDLEVSDALSGTTRPVNTLSGGESFLASLSLALGMADVVQSFAGGIRLETLFIDEGFGSLDAEALDLALRALIDLQQEGRLIGIISHVPELKERIDARLEVRPTRRGSTAGFVTSAKHASTVLRLPVS